MVRWSAPCSVIAGTRRRLATWRSETYPCHVWLTFADMHVVDVTFFPYRYYDRVPSPWRWSHYVLCSDPRHTLAADLPLRYVPMLVGLNAVEALIA